MTVTQIERDYSQHGEQPIILDVLSRMGFVKDRPRFLDLGAFDGLTGSNTRALSDQGWDGVLVEADPLPFCKLVANHRGNEKMSCVLAAVVGNVRQDGGRPGLRDGRVRPFYSAGDQISTAYGGHRLGDLVKQHWWVGCVTPEEIAASFGCRFEFISVDVEGCDLEVIKALGPVLSHTRLVVFEDTIPLSEFDADYYEQLKAVWREHGFTELVARTNDPGGKPCNTVLCRGKEWPGFGENGERRGESVRAESVEALHEHGVVRTWTVEEPSQRRTPSTADPAVLADPKARMERARSFRKMSLAEAGRRGAMARARRDVKEGA